MIWGSYSWGLGALHCSLTPPRGRVSFSSCTSSGITDPLPLHHQRTDVTSFDTGLRHPRSPLLLFLEDSVNVMPPCVSLSFCPQGFGFPLLPGEFTLSRASSQSSFSDSLSCFTQADASSPDPHPQLFAHFSAVIHISCQEGQGGHLPLTPNSNV